MRVQLNCRTCSWPAAISRPRKLACRVNTSRIPRAMSKTFSGLTIIAASPTTSGSELTLDVITGVPDAMASSGGNPNPSYKRRKYERARRRIEHLQSFKRNEPKKSHHLLRTGLNHRPPYLGMLRDFIADDQQPQVLKLGMLLQLAPDNGKGFDQPRDVLMRPDPCPHREGKGC